MNKLILSLLAALGLLATLPAQAQQSNLEVNTPAVAAIRASLKQRHEELRPYLDSGALGIAKDGHVALRDANLVSLSARQKLQGLIAAENADWDGLYREIANANGHPEWEAEVRNTFAQRRMEKAHPGWWVQGPGGWVKK
ncbi:MAG: DUF1318 domain-containing protein [Rhodocyclaceae bacterium]|nr:DUF1318 domain-containing protein [Rhodocyclaceae bacterium]